MATVERAADEVNAGEHDEAPWRTLEYFATTRVIVASALVLGAAAIGFRSPGAPSGLQAGLLMALGYFGASALFAALALYVHRRFMPQVLGQLSLDLVAVTTLVISSGGVASGWVILYLLPLAGASLLLPPMQVFFVCSIAVLAVLIDAGLRAFAPDAGDSMIFQAGVFGASLFAVSALLRALSARLASQERLARSRGRDLQNQLAINRLVIAQMDEGVIVVDRAGRVRANNRAARRMLGLDPSDQLTGEQLSDMPAGAGLAAAFSRVVRGRTQRRAVVQHNRSVCGKWRARGAGSAAARPLCAPGSPGLRRVRDLHRGCTGRGGPRAATQARGHGASHGVDRA